MDVDFGKTVSDYSRHRAGFPAALFSRLKAFEVGLAHQSLLDLGSGTGALARRFAAAGLAVVASDISSDMLAGAKELAEEEGLTLTLHQAGAEETGLEAGRFDVVTAGQCWHWFDRPRAAAEARRLLKPGGRLVVTHFDWLPLPGSMVEATEDLIRSFNPDWKMGYGTGLYPHWPADILMAGFEDLETFSFDEAVAYSHEDWRGRIRASAGVGGSLPPKEVQRFDQALADLLTARFPEDPLAVPHRCFALIARAKG